MGLDLNATWDRVRHIVPEFVPNPADLDAVFDQLLAHGQRLGRSRCLLQAVVARQPLGPLCAEHIETYVPLGPDTALITVAANAESRQGPHSIDDMHGRVDEAVQRIGSGDKKPIAQRIETLRQQGITFTNHATSSDIAQLTLLWQDTFGWDAAQLEAFVANLAEQQRLDPGDRQLWFVGARDSAGRLVGAAMAERLDMAGPDGTTVQLVESTEWATLAQVRRQGVMTVLVGLLNATVLGDLGNTDAHIFAECNYDARSYEVGLKASMTIPDREVDGLQVPQILRQNVAFDGELRSFVRTVLIPTQTTLRQASELLRDSQMTL
jgi:hypothetical protein